jgi:signal recognition particle subunit SRP54
MGGGKKSRGRQAPQPQVRGKAKSGNPAKRAQQEKEALAKALGSPGQGAGKGSAFGIPQSQGGAFGLGNLPKDPANPFGFGSYPTDVA